MKKLIWFLSMIPLVVTSLIFQFIPDKIPMHYDLEGNVDRWGSKSESFIFPIIILIIALNWHFLMHVFEKKAINAKTEKEQTEAKSNVKVLGIVGIAESVIFGIMHFVNLYSSWGQANIGSEKATVDMAKVSCLLGGILFIVLGNFMTKTKKNSTIGLRTVWSQYNDNTWRKSNRLAAIGMIIAGLLTVITTAFADAMVSTILMIAYLVVAAVVAVIYSKTVYDQEKEKEKNAY